MTNVDFTLISNTVKGIEYPLYQQEANPDHWKDIPAKLGILKTFTDIEKVPDADDGKSEIVYFCSTDKKAGCAVFQCLTGKNPEDALALIDDDEKQMDFMGFTISIEMKKAAHPDERSTNLRCATISFMMQDDDCICDILHEDIHYLLDELVEEAESQLHP